MILQKRVNIFKIKIIIIYYIISLIFIYRILKILIFNILGLILYELYCTNLEKMKRFEQSDIQKVDKNFIAYFYYLFIGSLIYFIFILNIFRLMKINVY